jgi:hypothetical protein
MKNKGYSRLHGHGHKGGIPAGGLAQGLLALALAPMDGCCYDMRRRRCRRVDLSLISVNPLAIIERKPPALKLARKLARRLFFYGLKWHHHASLGQAPWHWPAFPAHSWPHVRLSTPLRHSCYVGLVGGHTEALVVPCDATGLAGAPHPPADLLPRGHVEWEELGIPGNVVSVLLLRKS